jgi:hypothetical protein
VNLLQLHNEANAPLMQHSLVVIPYSSRRHRGKNPRGKSIDELTKTTAVVEIDELTIYEWFCQRSRWVGGLQGG